jgi:plasmid stability protein
LDSQRLKARATGNNRSLEAELREILVLASKQVHVATAKAAADAMRRRLEGRPHSDSGEILAEERLR